MHNLVEIALRGIPSSDALEHHIGEEVRRLEGICDHIRSCRVLAEALQRDKRQSVKITVRLVITLPGTEIVVNREHGDDVFMAVHDAFAAAVLQLEDHSRQGDKEHRPRSGASSPRS